MNWNSDILNTLSLFDTISNREGKQKVAVEIAAKVKDGDVIGVGSGSTAFMALLEIAKRVKEEGLNIKAIPTSIEISLTCAKLGIPQASLFENKPDWLFDGADEVDPDNNLIKGRGGALFKEKLMISACALNYIIIDESKRVNQLGTNFPVPIEVFPMALLQVEAKLKELGANSLVLRLAKGKDGPVITENGNLLLDAHFGIMHNKLEEAIKSITGVIESGLFIGYNVEILMA